MELRDYLRAFRRRGWIPILLSVIAVLTAAGLAWLSRPTYTATTTVFAAAPTGGSPRSITFPQVVTSNTLSLRVIRKLNLNVPADQLIHQIRVGVAGANLYPVSVTDANSDQATRLASEVAAQAVVLYRELAAATGNTAADQVLIKARDQLSQAYGAALTARLQFQVQNPSAFNPNAPIRDVDVSARALQLQLQEDVAAAAYRAVLAQVSQHGLDQVSQARDYNAFVLDQPVAKRNAVGTRVPQMLFAAVVAFAVGIGLVLLLEQFERRSVREPDAVEEMIGVPVIGIIPRATAQALRPATGGAG